MNAAALPPDEVVAWLSTMTSAVPSQVLTSLKLEVTRRRLHGQLFSEILNGCRLDDLEVEHLSPLHLSRLRKAWHAEFTDAANFRRDSMQETRSGSKMQSALPEPEPRMPERSTRNHQAPWAEDSGAPPLSKERGQHASQAARQEPEFRPPQHASGRGTQQAWQEPPRQRYTSPPRQSMSMNGSMGQGQPGASLGTGGNAPQAVLTALVVLVVDRLSQWANLEMQAALSELQDVLPSLVWEELAAIFLKGPQSPQMASVLFQKARNIVASEVAQWPQASNGRQHQAEPYQHNGHYRNAEVPSGPAYSEPSAAHSVPFDPPQRQPVSRQPAPRQNFDGFDEPHAMRQPAAPSIEEEPLPRRRSPPRQPEQRVGEPPKPAVASRPGPSSGAAASAPRPRPQVLRSGEQASQAPRGDASSSSRGPSTVAAWVRALPTSQVPEKPREALASSIEVEGIDGDVFTKVINAPAMLAARGVPSPAHALKVRKAWEQVLREDACRQIAMESVNSAKSTPKAVKLVF